MNFNDIAKQIKETDYNQIAAAFKGADFKSVMEHVKAVITTKYYCFDGRTASGDFWRYIVLYPADRSAHCTCYYSADSRHHLPPSA